MGRYGYMYVCMRVCIYVYGRKLTIGMYIFAYLYNLEEEWNIIFSN